MNEQEVRAIAQEEVIALHKRIGARLFGESGKSCLNLNMIDNEGNLTLVDNGFPYMSSDYRKESCSYFDRQGVLGEMAQRIDYLSKEVALLKSKKKVTKKAPAEKKVAKKKK